MHRTVLCILLCAALCASLLCGCGREPVSDGPKPWAATGAAALTEPETETTRQPEMSTLAALEFDEASITLPQGITATDIAQLETALWRAFFYHDQNFAEATAADALPFIADSAVPWGLRYIYDTFDPAHTHGEYEQLSVETEPDPFALFPDMYYRVDESVMDYLLRDVFGVEPDLTLETESAYYTDGYWYFNCLATGMAGNETHIRACQIVEEDHYRLTAELMILSGESEMTHEASAFVEIRRNTTDDAQVWQILNVETFE